MRLWSLVPSSGCVCRQGVGFGLWEGGGASDTDSSPVKERYLHREGVAPPSVPLEAPLLFPSQP